MLKDAFKWVAPSVVLIVYEQNGKRVSSGTAIFLHGLLVTNYHVYRVPKGRDVRIVFPNSSPKHDVIISDNVFHDALLHASPEDEFDYAFFDPAPLLPRARYGIVNRLDTPRMHISSVGDEVGIAGYPFGYPRITGHLCRITSVYDSGPAQMIQLEGSINVSNSGGPLFSLQEQAVIGIVTRKESGVSSRFKQLQGEIEKKIEAYAEPGYFGKRANAKLRDALIDTQRQMHDLTKEIIRSANTGIGYAISISHLLADPEFRLHAKA